MVVINDVVSGAVGAVGFELAVDEDKDGLAPVAMAVGGAVAAVVDTGTGTAGPQRRRRRPEASCCLLPARHFYVDPPAWFCD